MGRYWSPRGVQLPSLLPGLLAGDSENVVVVWPLILCRRRAGWWLEHGHTADETITPPHLCPHMQT